MSKENKIIKYNLQSEVDAMMDQGLSLSEIQTSLKNSHPDIIDIQNISLMSISRYKSNRDQNKIEEKLEEGKDPIDEFIKEYRNAIKKLLDKTENLYDESMILLGEAKQTENIQDKLKAVKEIRDNLEQERKSWVSLVQYGIRQTSNIYNINLKKEQNIKILLLKWSGKLCPSCRKKVSEDLKLGDIEYE